MHPDLPLTFEIVTLSILVAILAIDLLLAWKRPHIPKTRETASWVAFYVVLALVFAVVLWQVTDAQWAGEFIAGWLTEYSLSIDNLFVFVLIMTQFKVPRKLQQEVLMIGIIIALVLRGIFILLGAAIVESFSAVFYLFGAFLIYTAIKQAFGAHDEEAKESAMVRMIRRTGRVTDDFHGNRWRVQVDGRRLWTPMILVIVALGMTDLLFAVDSIPAIFGVTKNPFIIFTANIFALMGLRQLYFLLGDLLERLKYLHYGIAFILAFIGVKLILTAVHDNSLPFINGGEHILSVPKIDTWWSVGVIAVSMLIATVASLIASSREKRTLQG